MSVTKLNGIEFKKLELTQKESNQVKAKPVK